MKGTKSIVQALKLLLRRSGITYAQAAEALDLSEASIKRLFATQSFTLERVEKLCQLADAELVDLIRLADDDVARLDSLSEAQETRLAEDPKLLLVAICVLNRYRFEDVLALYAFDQHDLQRQFAALDDLGIIELQLHNRYRLKVTRGFRWIANGPIERFFVSSVFSSFMDRQLLRERDHFRFAWGTLSDESAARFAERLQTLAREFNDVADADARLPLDQRHGSALMLALRRNWEPAEFRKLRNATDS